MSATSQPVDAALAAVGSKSTYAGASVTVTGWLLSSEFAVLVGMLLGGWADETLSSCAYRMERAGRPWGRITRPLIDALFFFQPDHCRIAFECERQRVQAPPETRR